MIDIDFARAIHVIAIVHWIGGVFMVTAVILPSVARLAEPSRRIELLEAIEGRFSGQAKISVTLAGLSGFYMTHRSGLWELFLHAQFWYMHAMVLIWLIFTFILFIAEPFFLHSWFRRRAERDPAGTFHLIQAFHWVLLILSLVTIAGVVVGPRVFS